MSETDRPAPESVQAAVGRSIRHARNATAEAVLALRALLDAAALGLDGRAASDPDGRGALVALSRQLDEWARILGSESGRLPDSLADAILDALESEIARWEAQARTDPEARAVLRAFLGLREILWELGIRGNPDAGQHRPPASARPRPTRNRKPRVQRVDVEG